MTGILDYPIVPFANYGLFDRELFALSGESIDQRFEFQTITQNGRSRDQLIDHRTERTYVDDDITIVTIKEFILVGAIPAYMLANLTYQVAKTIIHFGFNSSCVALSFMSCSGEKRSIWASVTHLIDEGKNDLYEIVKFPIYALALELTALKGAVESTLIDGKKALEAKVIFADIEANLHNNARHTRGIRYFLNGVIEYHEIETTYLAPCFQPYRNRIQPLLVAPIEASVPNSIGEATFKGLI